MFRVTDDTEAVKNIKVLNSKSQAPNSKQMAMTKIHHSKDVRAIDN